VRLPYRALWRVAAFGWATFGLYYVYWAWSIGRARRELGHAGASPVLHGLAFVFVLFGGFLLARLGRLASEARGRSRIPRWGLAGFAFVLLGAISGRSEVALPFYALLPLPIVLVQREMNAGWDGARPSARPRWRDLPGLFAAAAVLLLLWSADRSALRAWVSPTARADQPVAGPLHDYRLVPHGLEWAVVPAGTNGDADADLELQARFHHAWIVVYRLDDPNAAVDPAIDGRIAALEGIETVTAFDEKRSLAVVRGHGLVTTSSAHFDTDGLFGRSRYHSRLVRTDGRLYEVIGWSESRAFDARVGGTVDSFELAAEAAP
jgi:hypothetical protein